MDVVSLGFLLLMVLVGGVSAFLADYLAWRIGKRRLSMMNMRPKHFARLVVTVAGMLIPLFTILALASASGDVRVWIARGRRAAIELPGVVEERDARVREVAALEAKRRSLETENRRAGGDLARQREAIGEQKARLASQTRRIAEQSRRIADLTPRLARLARRADLSRAQTDRLRRETDRARKDLAGAQRAVADAQARVAAAKIEVGQSIGEVRIARKSSIAIESNNAQAAKLYDELLARNTQIERRGRELQATTDRLAADVAALTASRDTARNEAEAARADLAGLQKEIADLQQQSRVLQIQRDKAGATVYVTRYAPLTFRSGDELARLVVPAGSSVAAARAVVRNLLTAARAEAERRGGQGGAATDLGEGEAETRNLAPEAKTEFWATRLAGRKADAVLVARSELNRFTGEAVSLDLAPYDDPVVFAPGAVVAEGRIDGRRPDAVVYAQIAEFLGTRVQDRAKRERMIPVRSGGEESYGEVTPGGILDATREARAANRPVRLQALADGEIRAGDRLKVTLRIR